MEVTHRHASATLPEGKNSDTHWREGWVWGGVGAGFNAMATRFPAPDGNQTPVVQPIVSEHIDWAFPDLYY
jgi:hypothetical protein